MKIDTVRLDSLPIGSTFIAEGGAPWQVIDTGGVVNPQAGYVFVVHLEDGHLNLKPVDWQVIPCKFTLTLG